MSARTVRDDPYASIAAYYDLEHDAFADDVDFYLQSIESVGDPVLELGCGSGRLIRPIAQAGWRVTGLDRSTAMLDRLRRSLTGSGVEGLVTVFEGDVEDAASAPGGPFGVVILGLNGLLHLSTPEQQIAGLRAARRSLDPRGQLLVDVMNPTLETLRALAAGVVHEGTWTTPEGTVVDKFSSRRIVSTEQIIHTRIWYDETDRDGHVRRTATAFDLRYVCRHELELMLRTAGFVDWQVYGGYELEPYDDVADRMIIAAEPDPRASLRSAPPG